MRACVIVVRVRGLVVFPVLCSLSNKLYIWMYKVNIYTCDQIYITYRSEGVTVDDTEGTAIESEISSELEVKNRVELATSLGDVVTLDEGSLRDTGVLFLRLVHLLNHEA